MRWDDDDLIFTAVKWQLHEASLVSVPADPSSGIRSFGTGHDRAAFIGTNTGNADGVLARMLTRQRMHERASSVIGLDDEDDQF
jgi:hypothetical protein